MPTLRMGTPRMPMQELPRNFIVRNLANLVSILGVLPICILFREEGYQYLLPLIIYNNVMDDLDGVLAGKLDIRSNLGALLDNVCDAIAHSAFVMAVGMYYFQETGQIALVVICLASSLVATGAMILRSVIRINPTSTTGAGSPTNELIRHIFFILLVSQIFEVDPKPYLIIALLLHTVSMLVPFRMPYLIRSLTKSAVAIGMVNVALIVAWLLPTAAPFAAAAFIFTYVASFVAEGVRWLREKNIPQ